LRATYQVLMGHPELVRIVAGQPVPAGSPAVRASSDDSHDDELRDYEAGLAAVLAGISALATDA
jgi:hypothetical protein